MDEFLDLLRRSNLLTREQWVAVWNEFGNPFPENVAGSPRSGRTTAIIRNLSPAEIARRLVERGWITQWQGDMLLAGRKAFFLGRYRLLECIGTGGMGAVFKAHHETLDRIVAIKIMSATVVRNRQALARFQQEIQAVAALNHPNIVAAYDADSVGNVHFLVMEYVRGDDLGQLATRQGRLPVGWACECIRQAALGLQHAHEQGMVHRDIKPSNLLVTTDPEGQLPLVKILDLGLARFVSETIPVETAITLHCRLDSGLTQMGQVLGTPDYIAPEQAIDTRQADIRSDLFSLGCTLFKLLTGELPFPGETVPEKLEAREQGEARRLREVIPEIPAELDRIVTKLLARNPRDRYQTPRELAQALGPFSAAAPVGVEPVRPPTVPRPTPPSTAVPSATDHRLDQFLEHLATRAEETVQGESLLRRLWRGAGWRFWSAAAAVAALLVAGFLVWNRWSRATLFVNWPPDERSGGELRVAGRLVPLDPSEEIAIAVKPGTWPVRVTRDGFEPAKLLLTIERGEQRHWRPVWLPTRAAVRRQGLAKLEQKLIASRGTDPLSAQASEIRDSLADFVRAHAGSPEAGQAEKWLSDLRWPLDILSPNDLPISEWGIRGAADAPGVQLELVALVGDSRLRFWNKVSSLAVSPDGRLFAAASRDGRICLCRMDDGAVIRCQTCRSIPTDVAFSPFGDVLAIAGDSAGVTLEEVDTGQLRSTLPGAEGPIVFSPGGRLLATRAPRQEISLWDAATGELRRTLSGHAAGELRDLVFSGNARMLASSSSDNGTILWDVASGQERRRFSRVGHPRFSPDGQFLAAGAVDGDLVLWDTATGETRRTMDEGGFPLAFAPDGRRLVSFRNGRAILWDLETGNELRTIVEVPAVTAVSPDGQALAAADNNFGGLTIWDLQNGAPRTLAPVPGPIGRLAFTLDSATLISGGEDHVVGLWDVASGRERPLSEPVIGPADLSADGRFLVFRRGGRIELWDLPLRETVRVFSGDATDVTSVTFSPDGKFVAGFGGWGFFKTSLRLWDVESGIELSLEENQPGTIRTIAISPDSQRVAAGGDSRVVQVWDRAGRRVVQTHDDFSDRVEALAWHPNGTTLAVACQDKSIALWNMATNLVRPLARGIPAPVSQLIFSPDGREVAGLAGGDTILVWNTDRMAKFAEATVGPAVITSLVFDSRDRRLIAGTNQGSLIFWKLSEVVPDPTLQIGPPGGIIRQVQSSPEGRHIVTANGNGTIAVWRLH